MRFQFSGTPQKHRFGCACVLCLPRPERFRQPEAWAHSPRVRWAFSLRGPSARCRSGTLRLAFFQRSWPLATTLPPPPRRWRSTIQNLSKSLDRAQRPFCSVGGGGFSGAEFSPFPSPLPPTSSGDGPALLWSFSVPLFCEPQVVCSGQLIFSLAIPQFKRAPSNCSQGLRAGPYPKQCCPLLSVPPLFVGGGCGRLGYFSAGSHF